VNDTLIKASNCQRPEVGAQGRRPQSNFLRIVIADRISQVVKRALLDKLSLSFLETKEKKDQKRTEVQLKEDKKILTWRTISA